MVYVNRPTNDYFGIYHSTISSFQLFSLLPKKIKRQNPYPYPILTFNKKKPRRTTSHTKQHDA